MRRKQDQKTRNLGKAVTNTSDLFSVQEHKGAVFSPYRQYRYLLWRHWQMEERKLAIIGLNPSTADEDNDDPTIRRCIDFANRWGFGGIYMLNMFAYRATDPKKMMAAAEPVGSDNRSTIEKILCENPIVLCAWGVHGTYRNQDIEVMHWLDRPGIKPLCLGRTKNHQPRHPLYIQKNVIPVVYKGR